MSLDVYLYDPSRMEPCECPDCGHEHSRVTRDCLYGANITHNLNRMAEEAGIYQHLWRPEEVGVERASQLIEPLRAGLRLLESDEERFSQFNAKNGWGLYEHLVLFVREYLQACGEHPGAAVEVSR